MRQCVNGHHGANRACITTAAATASNARLTIIIYKAKLVVPLLEYIVLCIGIIIYDIHILIHRNHTCSGMVCLKVLPSFISYNISSFVEGRTLRHSFYELLYELEVCCSYIIAQQYYRHIMIYHWVKYISEKKMF